MPEMPPDVPVWTIRPGTMARGWAARIEGPLSALDLEVVPALTLWDAYRATCDGVPLPFGAWMMQDGPTQTVADVRELRDAYDTLGEHAPRCQHCPASADERSFMCEDCAGKADEEAQNLRDEIERLRQALDEIVDDLSVPSRPAPWVAHALQSAQRALAPRTET